MRRAKEQKVRREMTRDKKLFILGIVGVVALLGVFVTLALTRERIAYAEAHDMVSAIAGTKSTIEDFLDSKPESLDFNEADQKKIDEFEAATEKCRNYIESLSASNVLKD